MPNKIQVDIVTPSSTIMSDYFNMIVVRTLNGELGILADHLPLISTLKEWPVKLKKDDGTVIYVSVSGGFMEVRDNKVTILAPTAELPEHIDAGRAKAALERAEKRLNEADKFDQARANAALNRAIGRLKTIELIK